ncbi:MAG: helix-turn-helix domain-containing protein [Thermoplasmata archaeon]|nr:helix-turn-helix domain-containing protein [Thermoplasmata archaeon]MCI4341706.1 helix-turn-helix domain-containing protein [Thermoplasmata archaeon]
MLTTTLEFRTDDLAALGVVPAGFFERYEELELLETLRLEPGWRLQLLRLKRRGPLRSIAELERESRRIRRLYGLTSFEVVERRPRQREWVLLVRQRNPERLAELLTLAGGRITPTAPFRMNEERVVASFRGDAQPLRRVLSRLRRDGLEFRVLRSSQRPYETEDSTDEITSRQRSVLGRALLLGYFSVPRRITLTRLARLTGRSPPALGKMLRRAQHRLVASYFARESGPSPELGDGAARAPGGQL